MSLEHLADPGWPACWLFANRSDERGSTRVELGAKMSRDHKKGGFVYHCDCGENFSRVEGESNDEAASWVARHVRHVAPA